MILSESPKIELLNVDCMEYMATLEDNTFDLAIVDPPYGIGKKLLNGGHNGTVKFHENYAKNEWDDYRPDKKYFDELFRVSKNQIIWGANYYIDFLKPSRGVICWDKNLGSPYNFSHWEMAWTSFDCIAKRIILSSNQRESEHPTEKPIKLYKWLLHNYAKEGDKILDTHLGSGSSAIAAHKMNYDFVGTEIYKEYCDAATKRFKEQTMQQSLFK